MQVKPVIILDGRGEILRKVPQRITFSVGEQANGPPLTTLHIVRVRPLEGHRK